MFREIDRPESLLFGNKVRYRFQGSKLPAAFGRVDDHEIPDLGHERLKLSFV
jgi:hypothetical protein